MSLSQCNFPKLVLFSNSFKEERQAGGIELIQVSNDQKAQSGWVKSKNSSFLSCPISSRIISRVLLSILELIQYLERLHLLNRICLKNEGGVQEQSSASLPCLPALGPGTLVHWEQEPSHL